MEKILTDNGQLQVFDGHPAQPGVQFHVAGHGASHAVGNILKLIDVAQCGVQLHVARQVHRRADRELVLRIAAFAAALVDVQASLFQPKMFVQIGVTRLPTPPARQLIAPGQFRSVSLSLQTVGNRYRLSWLETP